MMLSHQARRSLIRSFISESEVNSQQDLLDLLHENGVETTQATISRDLEEIGALRKRDGQGKLRYFLEKSSNSSQINHSRTLVHSSKASGNLVVVQTPPGGAQLLASDIDHAVQAGTFRKIIGTIAGDDTVLVIASTPTGGEAVRKTIEDYYLNNNGEAKNLRSAKGI